MSDTAEAVITFVPDTDKESKAIFGFWIYIMTDCVLFASLFATYAVLRNNTFGGPDGAQIFNLPYVLAETIVLLTSSFTCGLGILSARRRHKNKVLMWFSISFFLGLTFLALELSDFRHLAAMGDSWRRSGFLSAFFTLVGTHGAHITVGLFWMATMLFRIWQVGLTKANVRRLTLLSIFWHFLDLIWIFIFTIVYLFGVMQV
ncbi:MAG TPA: cytochrome o ubiquinol oxidase subunit III [Candidatus Sulfotelmatobacter sp.]|nr:cytochrome o ubiquinol oxidase subunit III [Candidatus Sulfotelmatobacter sp.]